MPDALTRFVVLFRSAIQNSFWCGRPVQSGCGDMSSFGNLSGLGFLPVTAVEKASGLDARTADMVETARIDCDSSALGTRHVKRVHSAMRAEYLLGDAGAERIAMGTRNLRPSTRAWKATVCSEEIGYRLSLEPVWPSRMEHEVHVIEGEIERTLRFATLGSLAPLGVAIARYHTFDYQVRLQRQRIFLEFDSLIVPSARFSCANLAPSILRYSQAVDWESRRRRHERR